MASKPRQDERVKPEFVDSVSNDFPGISESRTPDGHPSISTSNLNDSVVLALSQLASAAELSDVTSVCEKVLSCLVSHTTATFGIVALYEDLEDTMAGVCCQPESRSQPTSLRFKLAEDPFSQSALSDRRIRLLRRLTNRHPFAEYLAEFAADELAIVPLISESSKVGAIYLGGATGIFSDSARDFLSAMVTKSSAMINNARQLQSFKLRMQHEEMMKRLTLAAVQLTDIEQVLSQTTEELTATLCVDRSQIIIFERSFESARVWYESISNNAVSGFGRDFQVRGNPLLNIKASEKPLSVRRSQSLSDQTRAKVVSDSDLDDVVRSALSGLGKNNVRALIGAPLRIGGETLGLLFVEQIGSPRHWLSEEISLTEQAAAFAAGLIKQIQLKNKLKGSARRTEALFQAGSLLNDSPDLDALLNSIFSVMRDFLGASASYVMLLDPPGENLILRGGYTTFADDPYGNANPLPERLSANGTSLAAQALVSKRMIYMEDTMGEAVGSPINSAVAFPIGSTDRLYGALVIESDRPAIFDGDDLKLLSSFARNLTGALEQTRLFKMLAAAAREWEATFDSVSDALFIYDEFGRIARANIAALNLAKEKWPELRGRYDWRSNKWVLIDEVHPVRKALASKVRCETQAVAVDGARSEFFHIDVDPVIDEQGRAVGAIEILRDLTQLKLAEQKALEQRNFFESLVEHAFDAIFTVDLQGRITWFNNRTPVLTGYKSEDLLGLAVDGLVSSDAPVRMGFFFNEISKGRPQIFETKIVRPDGESLDLMITGAPVLDGARVTCSIVIARDITNQKRVSERMMQSDKLRALGELASGVAHDFNNILSVILGRAQLLQSRIEDEQDAKDSQVILQAAIDGSRIVKRIQNFARVRADHDFIAVDLNKIARDAVNITRTRWKHEAERHGIITKVTTNLGKIPMVSGDPSELREVMVNLIFNAVDAMPDGGEITIETVTDGVTVRLNVTDTGVGMDEVTRNRIFDPFYTTKGVSGTGLGLSVSYGIITRHNSTIEVQSEIGRGTVFTITMPIRHDIDRKYAHPSAVHAAANLLVVDDEQSVRELLADTLDSASYRVSCACSGEEAIELARMQKFDLVLTDLGMPGMNGWEVARTIKMLNPDLPIIMITGWGVELEPEALQTSGVDLVINKPFDLKVLLNSIDSQLKQGPYQKELFPSRR